MGINVVNIGHHYFHNVDMSEANGLRKMRAICQEENAVFMIQMNLYYIINTRNNKTRCNLPNHYPISMQLEYKYEQELLLIIS